MQVLIGLLAVISRRSWRLIQLWMEEVSLVRLIMRSCYLIELSIGSFVHVYTEVSTSGVYTIPT